jgi:phospholipid/cholesterol/gamma-HCH transport system substrate-binding protein
VGRLLNDKALYDDMRRTLRDVNLLVRDIRANPHKYLKLSLF